MQYMRRYGVQPQVHPKIKEETLSVKQQRYKGVRAGLNFFREKPQEKKPDALILIGDDQNENFKEENLPQIAIYLREQFIAMDRHTQSQGLRRQLYRCHTDLAASLLNGLIDRDFDVAYSKTFANDELLAHAHAPILTPIRH